MWSGPLHDKTFVKEVLKHVEDSEAVDASTATEAPTTEETKNTPAPAAPSTSDVTVEGHVFRAKYGTASRRKGMLTVASEVRAFVVHVYTTDQQIFIGTRHPFLLHARARSRAIPLRDALVG